MLFIEIIYNGGFEPLSIKGNIWLGPSADTLVFFGAKVSPLMTREGGFQVWRFITPMFIHVGVFHLILNLFAQIPMGFQLEKSLGVWRLATLYLFGGIGGNLLSSVFLPNAIECGASTSLFAWISVYIVDYLMHFKYYRGPLRKIVYWIIGTIISLAIGLLPGIDNFAHLGGSMLGFSVAMVILNPINKSLVDSSRWIRYRIIGVLLSLAYLLIFFYVFYFVADVTEECEWCNYISCLPEFKSWC